MKSLLYILPALMVLPISSFAQGVRPFIGYNVNLMGLNTLKIKDSAGQLSKTEGFNFNNGNAGSFVLGMEVLGIGAISLDASLSNTKITPRGEDYVVDRMNEVDVKLDFYLTRNISFKPFVSISTGFASMNNNYDGVKSYGMVFGAGLGFRQYMSNHFYVNTDLRYNIYPDMGVKTIGGTGVGGTTMQMSELSLNVGIGYRF